MSGEGGKIRGVAFPGGPSEEAWAPPAPPPQPYYYGTFQGVVNSQPVIGFPQPMPPPAVHGNAQHYYSHGYQTVPGYAVPHGRPYLEHRLPCGIGIGWLLFIFGFIFGAFPWYVGAFILLCIRVDYREKPGLIACTLASILAMIAIMMGVTRATHGW